MSEFDLSDSVTNNYYGDSIKPLISKWEEYKTIKNSLEFADFMDWLAEEF